MTGFFIRPGAAGCADKLSGAVLSFVEGRINKATARCDLRIALAEINNDADDERLDLCIDTAHALACGYVQWLGSQTNIDFYPALELRRVYQREEIVDWTQTWREYGGRVFSGDRMVALKNDPIWSRISEFHLPFPPFDLGSGMDVEGVSRSDAKELGLLGRNDRAEVGSLNLDFEDALRARVELWFSERGDSPR